LLDETAVRILRHLSLTRPHPHPKKLMRSTLARWLALAVLTALPSAAAAQHTLAPGDTVRVLAPAFHPGVIEGELLVYRTDTLAVRESATGTAYAFPLSAVRRLHKNEGPDRRRSVRKWALAGLFVGTSVGLVGGPFIATADDEGGIVGPTLLTGLAGGVLGLGLGAAGGSIFSNDHWQRFRTPIVPPAPPRAEVAVRIPVP
jgi:hypothetical protein